MKIKQVMHGFTSMFAVATVFSTMTLHAAQVQSEKISIPFSFQVQKTSLPAGDYRLERTSNSPVASLVNLQTGERVQVLRSESEHEAGKARLFFESKADGEHLKKIS